MLIPRANVTRTTFLQQFFFRFSQWIINSIWMKAKEENFHVAEERKLRKKIREECLFATDMLLLVPSSGTWNFSISSRKKAKEKFHFVKTFSQPQSSVANLFSIFSSIQSEVIILIAPVFRHIAMDARSKKSKRIYGWSRFQLTRHEECNLIPQCWDDSIVAFRDAMRFESIGIVAWQLPRWIDFEVGKAVS